MRDERVESNDRASFFSKIHTERRFSPTNRSTVAIGSTTLESRSPRVTNSQIPEERRYFVPKPMVLDFGFMKIYQVESSNRHSEEIFFGELEDYKARVLKL